MYNRIWNFRLFRNSTAGSKKLFQQQKINVVGSHFGFNSRGDLKYDKAIHPYKDLKLVDDLSTHRLSVTKLLTKSWCELRFAYDTYSRMGIYKDEHVKIGEQVHKSLEDELLEPMVTPDMIPGMEDMIRVDDMHKLANDWLDATNRLLNMFEIGEAREVLCHGYLDKTTDTFIVNTPVIPQDHLLVSGIIDHLTLKPNPIMLDPAESLGDTIDYLTKNLTRLQKTHSIEVSDVKTRSRRSVPSQPTVVTAAKTQVMYYRHFLELLGRDPTETYEMLLANAKARGIDTDTPLSTGNVMLMILQSNNIIDDFIKLHDGDLFGFEKFDVDRSLENSTMELGSVERGFLEFLENGQEKVLQVFEGPFATPVTLKYFAMRLAQAYHIIGSMLSDRLQIEYYHSNENFANITFEYDEAEFIERCKDASRFWFGKRGIEPIDPTLYNYEKYCRLCDFKDHCSWIKDGIAETQKLGSELTEIINTNHQL